jgi:hypothetical protein
MLLVEWLARRLIIALLACSLGAGACKSLAQQPEPAGAMFESAADDPVSEIVARSRLSPYEQYLVQAGTPERPQEPRAVNAGAPHSPDCAAALHLPWGPIQTCKAAIITTTVATVAVASFLAWWDQGFDSSFNFANEGWFGPDTYAGGVDKLGHAFSFYVGTRLGTRALEWADVPRADAVLLSAGVAAGVAVGIEVFDGLSRGGEYGFSWQDLLMGGVGIGLGIVAENYPAFDRYAAFRWMYKSGGESWYDHQVYLAALRLSGFESIGRDNPLRYIELVVGYGAQGFGSDGDYSVSDTRERSVYFGVALNLTEILDRTVFAGRHGGGRMQWFATEALRYVQVPGTAALANKTWQP